MNSQRVAVVTGIPAPYREPVFERLAQRPETDLRVFYCAHGHGDVAWDSDRTRREYPCEFLPNLTPRRLRRLPMLGYTNISVTSRLREFAPDYVVVYGYNQLTHWLTFRYCRKNSVPFALRSDSNILVDTSATWRSHRRRRMIRRVVNECHAVLPVGTANRDYWRKYGAVDRQIHMAPYAVDNDRIARLTAERRIDHRPCVHFLYAGRLIERKGVDALIEAYNRLIHANEARLTIIGDGPLLEPLQKLQTTRAAASTRWLGKLSNDDVFSHMADADVFVLPSHYEPWGLVVNEAMAAGLPVIADRKCGAAVDLIDHGQNGWKLDGPSVENLQSAMQLCLDDPSRLREMGWEAREAIGAWNFDATVDGFVAAVHAAAEAGAGESGGKNDEDSLAANWPLVDRAEF